MNMPNYEDEKYPPYEDYYDQGVWPNVSSTGEIELSYVDTMAPQHCSSAIYKIKRWNESQWAREMDVERNWLYLQTTMLVRLLQAKASGTDDWSSVHEKAAGVNVKALAYLMVGWALQGGQYDQYPSLVAAIAERAAINLSKAGYIVIRPE